MVVGQQTLADMLYVADKQWCRGRRGKTRMGGLARA